MLYKLHYLLVVAGYSALNILLGVYMKTYTDASSFEIGMLLMLMPVSGIFFRPIICSMADRSQQYQKYLMILLASVVVSYSPFLIIPFLGPQVYEQHARTCWYVLLVSKVLGDIASSGMFSIGDSLAINYAERIGTEYQVYRVWGTISWMSFGLVIGQVNEVSFMPKYVPAFVILTLTFLLDFLIVWLWPSEYFQMVPVNRAKKVEKKSSLMSRELVVAQMKEKILWLISFGSTNSSHNSKASTPTNNGITTNNNDTKSVENNSTGAVVTLHNTTATTNHVNENKKKLESNLTMEKQDDKASSSIDKKTQFLILMTLIRKDPRIVGYLLFFMCAGASLAPISFFFISLSNICHDGGKCDFSQLAGMLQFSMACAEAVLFIYVKDLAGKLGRLNICALGILCSVFKYGFYATVWRSVDPHYTLLVEIFHGISFGIFMVVQVEMGHLFANEVEFILPELVERAVITANVAQQDKVKMSLAATMQSLVHSAQDGIGQGCGALIYGLLLEHYSFETLWMIVATGAGIVCIIVLAISMADYIFKFELGLDVKEMKKITKSSTATTTTTAIDKQQQICRAANDKLNEMKLENLSCVEFQLAKQQQQQQHPYNTIDDSILIKHIV